MSRWPHDRRTVHRRRHGARVRRIHGRGLVGAMSDHREELKGAILAAVKATRRQSTEYASWVRSETEDDAALTAADETQRAAMNRVWALLYNLTPDDVQNIADFRHKRMEQQ